MALRDQMLEGFALYALTMWVKVSLQAEKWLSFWARIDDVLPSALYVSARNDKIFSVFPRYK